MLDRVTEYAQKVVSGKIICGDLHRLACKRHLADLNRQNTKTFPYYWSVEKSNDIIDFAETLTIAEGENPKPVKLIPSQAFDLGCTFGWLKVSNNKRRFRRRYKSVARQNGKTFENGIMGTYIALLGGYRFGKLFTVATKKRQSKLAWEEISKFINIDNDLKEYFQVKEYKSLITCTATDCTIEALSKEAGLDDGFRSIFSSIDEIHQHKDNKIYKALYDGTRSMPETLQSMITTRGEKLNSFCKEMDNYCVNILYRTVIAEDFFVDIYCLDKDDDIYNPENYIKANPYLCTTTDGVETLLTDSQTARNMGGSELKDFIIKDLNLWCENTDNQYVDSEKWSQCGTYKTLKDFIGYECYVGLDLSSGGDLTTIALEFIDGSKYYFYSHSFMPRGRIEEHIKTDLVPYDIWEHDSLITVTGGETDFKNDYKSIISHLKELQETYNLKFVGIGIDPHNADGILSDLENFGCPVVVIVQSCRSLNDATVDIRLLVKSLLVEYDKSNTLMAYSFLNATTVQNSFKEIKVDKQSGARNQRIDPVDACIDAHALMLKSNNISTDVGNSLDTYLNIMGWD